MISYFAAYRAKIRADSQRAAEYRAKAAAYQMRKRSSPGWVDPRKLLKADPIKRAAFLKKAAIAQRAYRVRKKLLHGVAAS